MFEDTDDDGNPIPFEIKTLRDYEWVKCNLEDMEQYIPKKQLELKYYKEAIERFEQNKDQIVNSIELQFEQAVSEHSPRIRKLAEEGMKLLWEAQELSKETGVPFKVWSCIEQAHLKYFPYSETFQGLDDKYYEQLSISKRELNATGRKYGWVTSDSCGR